VGLLDIELAARGQPRYWVPILLAVAIGPIGTSQVAAFRRLSPSRACAIISAAATAGWVEALGDRRGRRYVAGPDLRELPLRSPVLMECLRRGLPNPEGSSDLQAGISCES
jgi:hypothetical protein